MSGIDVFFFLWAASLIFFMKAGFVALEIGQFRSKNVSYHCVLKLLDLSAVFIGYLFVGYGIAYGFENIAPLIFGNFDMELGSWFMKMVTFAAAAVTIITGGVAERIKIMPYFIGALIVGLLAGLQQPFTYKFIEEKLKIDDVCAIGPVHAMSGLIGVILAGVPFLLKNPSGVSFIGQILGALAIILISIIGGLIIYKGLDISIGLRVSKDEEEAGLDSSILQVEVYSEE